MEAANCNNDVKLWQDVPAGAWQKLSYLLKTRGSNDWRMLAAELDFNTESVHSLMGEQEPVIALLKQWQIKEGNLATVNRLISALQAMKRADAVQDIQEFIAKTPIKGASENNYSKLQSSNKSITVHDSYDVFIVYAKPDLQFAQFLLEKLSSSPYNFSVCIDYKDFLPGEDNISQIAKVIESVCKKVIVILSDDFRECEMCDFQVKLVLTLSPSCRQRRLIPILYKPCEIPRFLKFVTYVDYSETEHRDHFWTRLTKAIK